MTGVSDYFEHLPTKATISTKIRPEKGVWAGGLRSSKSDSDYPLVTYEKNIPLPVRLGDPRWQQTYTSDFFLVVGGCPTLPHGVGTFCAILCTPPPLVNALVPSARAVFISLHARCIYEGLYGRKINLDNTHQVTHASAGRPPCSLAERRGLREKKVQRYSSIGSRETERKCGLGEALSPSYEWRSSTFPAPAVVGAYRPCSIDFAGSVNYGGAHGRQMPLLVAQDVLCHGLMRLYLSTLTCNRPRIERVCAVSRVSPVGPVCTSRITATTRSYQISRIRGS